jgi:hypothetical protein
MAVNGEFIGFPYHLTLFGICKIELRNRLMPIATRLKLGYIRDISFVPVGVYTLPVISLFPDENIPDSWNLSMQ